MGTGFDRWRLPPSQAARTMEIRRWAPTAAAGGTLRQVRELRGLSVEDVAGRLGWPPADVEALEREVSPETDALTAYVHALGGVLDVLVYFGADSELVVPVRMDYFPGAEFTDLAVAVLSADSRATLEQVMDAFRDAHPLARRAEPNEIQAALGAARARLSGAAREGLERVIGETVGTR